MFKNIKDIKLSFIPSFFFIAVVVFSLLFFFATDYYFISSSASLLDSFEPQTRINLQQGWYNRGSIDMPYALTIDITNINEPVIAVRFFINGEEINIDEGKRPFEAVEENGKRFIRLLYTTVPFNAVDDGHHIAKAIIIYGESEKTSLTISSKRFSVDYTNPEVELVVNSKDSSVVIRATDENSGISDIAIYKVNVKKTGFEEATDIYINNISQSQTYQEINIQNLDPNEDYIAFILDGAENVTLQSLHPNRSIIEISKEIRRRLDKEFQTSRIPPVAGGDSNECGIHLKYFYYDTSTKNFGNWWGKDPISKKYRKEEVIERVQASYPYSVPEYLKDAVDNQVFSGLKFFDFWNPGGIYAIEKLRIEPKSGLKSEIIDLPNFETDRGVILDWNRAYSIMRYFEEKKFTDDIIPIIIIDESINLPGFPNGTNGGFALVQSGIIFMNYLAYVNFNNLEEDHLIHAIAHELGHIHGLGHVNQISNLMNGYPANIFYYLNLSQAAAFMAHTRDCFDQSFQPEISGVYVKKYVYKTSGCGIVGDRLLGERLSIGLPDIEECENTFADPFFPTPGSTQIELGAGTPEKPLSFCPVITDPDPTRQVLGVTLDNVGQFQPEQIKYCIPPPYNQQCTCLTESQIRGPGSGIGHLVTPKTAKPAIPPPDKPTTGEIPQAPDTPGPECGNDVREIGEECGEPGLPRCTQGKKCIDCLCQIPQCGNGKKDKGEQCGEPGLTCKGTLGPPAPGFVYECNECQCYSVGIGVPPEI